MCPRGTRRPGLVLNARVACCAVFCGRSGEPPKGPFLVPVDPPQLGFAPVIRGFAQKIAIGAAVVVCIGAALFAYSKYEQSRQNRDVVKAYCSGAVSNPQYQGCIHHASKARIDQLANNGDQTAINAENVDCSEGNAFQDGDC
jgi:hypothetical protein